MAIRLTVRVAALVISDKPAISLVDRATPDFTYMNGRTDDEESLDGEALRTSGPTEIECQTCVDGNVPMVRVGGSSQVAIKPTFDGGDKREQGV